jgi:hypothetical protein
MERGSKYNPYQCPECGYRTTRKWNMGLHLQRAHGLVPMLPERSLKDWVFAQLHTLARRFAEAELAGDAEAELAGDKERRDQTWWSLLSLYRYHSGLFPIEYIVQVIGEKRRELQRQRAQSGR